MSDFYCYRQHGAEKEEEEETGERESHLRENCQSLPESAIDWFVCGFNPFFSFCLPNIFSFFDILTKNSIENWNKVYQSQIISLLFIVINVVNSELFFGNILYVNKLPEDSLKQ